ncbi:uncharacterized short-chain type dehydrogenase/reductase y4vI-like isoform X2 [Scylla paramamosain]|uniref:uncharacterized short-chain type dehydrogenase/reductase y4vI-like isoform X2 n=1 Tax=Scylla paramamosain TaxID=85552 RepID=UPI003083379C
MAPDKFHGQVALVTGGGSGIGRATCLQLAKEGARVVVTSRTLQAAQETLSMLPNSTDHLALQMDVTQQRVVEGVMAAIRERFGKSPTLLVNCAGFFERAPLVEMEESSFCKAIDVNLKGTFLVTQAVTKALLDEDKEEEKEGRGVIVNIASISGKTGFPGASHCAASKGGVVALTKSCAAEMARKGIRINCVLPGIIDTPMARRVDQKEIQKRISVNPLGRAGRPEEVAEVVVFLLSARSSYMVGACVEVTGGSGLHCPWTHSAGAAAVDASMAPSDFTGQVALVTGGGSGIGRATCFQLARDGARVVVTDINVQTARETLSLMPNPEKHLALQMDVTQQSAVQSVITTARDKYGEPPSLLVNAAGILITDPSVDKTGTDVINVNLKGIFLVTQAFTEELLRGNEGAQEEKGVIVNIASIIGKIGHPKNKHYAASKGGVIAYSKSCAAEMARKGIRVNCVLPGLVKTALSKRLSEEQFQAFIDKTPLGRYGKTEEIAEVIVFLLSRRSSFMVGACVEISGGAGM